jgi:nitrile hydratase
VSDENRRTIESLEPTTYAESAYYERWVLAMKSLLLEKGILTEQELDAKVAEVRSRKSLAQT